MEEITFKLEIVTPKKADEYLKHNIRNRKPRRQVVNELCTIIAKDEWRVVHQPIAFDGVGRLVDGQHRLMAIVKTGEALPMYVARYRNEETAMNLPIDRQSRRSVADILEGDKKTIETVTAIIEVAMGRERRIPTIGEVEVSLKSLSPELEVLHDRCNNTAKVRSTQAVRGAVVCNMRNSGQLDLIAEQFRACLLLDFASCKPSVLAFIKACDSHAGGGGASRKEMFIRALKAFDPSNWEKTTSRINANDTDWQPSIDSAKATLGWR
jgi:hypothetical protein